MKMRPASGIAAVLTLAALGLLLVGAAPAAADDCVALGGRTVDGECWVETQVLKSGAFTVAGTLRIHTGGRIVVPQQSAPAAPNVLTLTLGGSLIMEPGAAIVGDATGALGLGSTIRVTAARDIVLGGIGGSGAAVSSNGDLTTCAPGGAGGNITLVAVRGNIAVQGHAFIQSTSWCPTGNLELTAHQGDISVEGLIESASGLSTGGGTTLTKSGIVTLAAGRNVTVARSGRISSRALHTADRVHIESGIDTAISGLVESLGGVTYLANTCTGTVRPGKPAASTACVEMWAGGRILVDNSTSTQGAVFAETGYNVNVGYVCCGWIDLFANGDISVTGPPTFNGGDPFALNARQFSSSGASLGGLITVKAVKGKISARGRAVITDAASGTGGNVSLEAGGPVVYPVGVPHGIDAASNVDLYDAYVSAAGVAGHGNIYIRSYNGDITGGPASNGATLDASGAGGQVTFQIDFCGGPSYSGTILPPGAVILNSAQCGGNPTPPAFVAIPLPPPTITVVGGTFVENYPTAYPATVTVTGLAGEDLVAGPNASLLTVAYTDATTGAPLPGAPNVEGTYTATATFAGNASYRPASETGTIIVVASTAPQAVIDITTANTTLTRDANGTITSAATVVPYSGDPRPETGQVLAGPGGAPLGPPVVAYREAGVALGGAPIDAGLYDFTATDPGFPGYRIAAPVSGTITITRVDPVLVLTGAGTFTYSGVSPRVIGTARGVQNETLSPALGFVYYDTAGAPMPPNVFPVNVGTYPVTASFAGNRNYHPASRTVSVVITPATPTVTVPDVTVASGAVPAVSATVTGVGVPAPTLPGTGLVFTYCTPFVATLPCAESGTAPTVSGLHTIVARYPGDGGNYGPAAGIGRLTVLGTKVATVTVGSLTVTYDGLVHSVTGTVVGEGGVVLGVPTITYNGSPRAPVDAGTYGVLGTFAGNTEYAPADGAGQVRIDPATPVIALFDTGTFPYDGQPHPATATVTGALGEPLAPVTITYNGSPDPPLLGGSYTVLASYEGGPNYVATSTSGTTIISAPMEACLLVDFREVTYFRDRAVMTSSDPTILAAHGLGDFDPAAWPYTAQGGSRGSKSRGSLFRIYGFKAEQVGNAIMDADDSGVTYTVVEDPDIPGTTFIDLGGPARVVICPSQLQENLLETHARVEAASFPGTRVLTDAEKNVPGITLSHNAARIRVPRAVKDELRALGMPLVDARGRAVDYGIVEFIGLQQYGGGNSVYREFVEAEVLFLFDALGTDPASRTQHYTLGFHTVKRGDQETGVGCSYVDYAPGDDGLRYNDVWEAKFNGHPNWGLACGRKEPRVNQIVREDYDVPLNAVQVLSTVNANEDTIRIFFGRLTPDGAKGTCGTKGNNGVGNGLDPQPPGNPPVNDGPGTSPGGPGSKASAEHDSDDSDESDDSCESSDGHEPHDSHDSDESHGKR